jgi:hypothetical protein
MVCFGVALLYFWNKTHFCDASSLIRLRFSSFFCIVLQTKKVMVKLELNLPWKPVLAWPWGVTYTIDRTTNLITKHEESWDIEPLEVREKQSQRGFLLQPLEGYTACLFVGGCVQARLLESQFVTSYVFGCARSRIGGRALLFVVCQGVKQIFRKPTVKV